MKIRKWSSNCKKVLDQIPSNVHKNANLFITKIVFTFSQTKIMKQTFFLEYSLTATNKINLEKKIGEKIGNYGINFVH